MSRKTGRPVRPRGVSLTVDKKKMAVAPERIAETVRRLGREINARFTERDDSRPPLVVGVMNGAFMFLADLVREFRFDAELNFIRVSSYGKGETSSGRVRLIYEPDASPAERDVLIVEDMIDSGRTLAFLIDYFRERGAKSVAAAVLLDKPARRVVDVPCDFVGMTVEDRFLAGYGLDGGGLCQQYRFIFEAERNGDG